VNQDQEDPLVHLDLWVLLEKLVALDQLVLVVNQALKESKDLVVPLAQLALQGKGDQLVHQDLVDPWDLRDLQGKLVNKANKAYLVPVDPQDQPDQLEKQALQDLQGNLD